MGPIYFGTPSPTIDLTGGPGALDVTNLSQDLGTVDTLTGLSLLSATFSGGDSGDFLISGFTPDTVLFEQQMTSIDLSVINPGSLAPGTYSTTLLVQTDQEAPFGTDGQVFSYTVEYTVVPEPASLSVLGGVLLLMARPRRRARGMA